MKKLLLGFIAAVISCCMLAPIEAKADGESPCFIPCNGEIPGEVSTEPTFGDYVFDGWYTQRTNGEKVTSGFENGETYYAHWKTDATETALNVLTETVVVKDGKFYDVSDNELNLTDYGFTLNRQYGAGGELTYMLIFENIRVEHSMADGVGTVIAFDETHPVHISFNGTNIINVDKDRFFDHINYEDPLSVALYSKGDMMLFGGDDSILKINGNCTGIKLVDADLSIRDKVNLDINMIDGFCRGIEFDENTIDVTGNGINIKIHSTEHGIYSNNGTVNINAGNIEITAEILDSMYEIWTGNAADAIYVSELNITGGTIKLDNFAEESPTILASDFNMTGGTLYAKFHGDSSEAILCMNSLTVGSAEKPATVENEKKLKLGFGLVTDRYSLEQKDANEYLVIKFVPLTKYTVKFNTNGGTPAPADQETFALVTEPDKPSKDGYVFAGWYYDKYFTRGWYFETEFAESDMTLYAKWVSAKADVSATVVWESPENTPVENAIVTIVGGRSFVANVQTDSQGAFTLPDIPEGRYMLMARKNTPVPPYPVHNCKTIITVVVDSEGNVTFDGVAVTADTKIVLNNSTNVYAVLQYGDGAPEVTVEGLMDAALPHKNPGTDITFLLEVKALSAMEIPVDAKASIEDLAQTVSGAAGFLYYYFDMSTYLQEGYYDPEAIHDTGEDHVLTIRIPFITDGRTDFHVYRYHDDEAMVFAGVADENGEYVEIGENEIIVHARFFSTYAIVYQIDDGKKAVTVTNNGHGSAVAKVGDVTVDRATPGDTVTLNCIPAMGYKVGSITVTSNNATVSALYTFTMPDTDVTINVTFVEQDWGVSVYPQGVSSTGNLNVYAKVNGTQADRAHAGDTITLYHDTKPGYTFKGWRVDSGDITIVNDSFTMPAGNVAIAAMYEQSGFIPPLTGNDSLMLPILGILFASILLLGMGFERKHRLSK